MSQEHALSFVKDELKKCFAAQVLATAQWHDAKPQSVADFGRAADYFGD